MRHLIWNVLVFLAGFIAALAVTAKPRSAAQVQRVLYPDGSLQLEYSVDEHGRMDGAMESYWPDGRHHRTEYYRNGEKGAEGVTHDARSELEFTTETE